MTAEASRNRELLRGTLDVLVLTAVSHHRQHGFGVARWLESFTNEELQIQEGSLYPALHRLKQRGLLEAEWGVSDNNRRVKFYRITATGRARLAAEVEGWQAFSAAVTKVLGTAAVSEA